MMPEKDKKCMTILYVNWQREKRLEDVPRKKEREINSWRNMKLEKNLGELYPNC